MRTIEQALAPYEVTEQWLGRHYVEDHAVDNGLLGQQQLASMMVMPGQQRTRFLDGLKEVFWDGVTEWQKAARY